MIITKILGFGNKFWDGVSKWSMLRFDNIEMLDIQKMQLGVP